MLVKRVRGAKVYFVTPTGLIYALEWPGFLMETTYTYFEIYETNMKGTKGKTFKWSCLQHSN